MDNYKTIITFTYPQDAHLAKNYLESEGIETEIRDELTAQVNNFYSNAIGGVKLAIKESDFEAGIRILIEGGYIKNEHNIAPLEFLAQDLHTDKTICPYCASKNIAKKREPNIVTIIVYFILGAIFPIFKRSYTCFDCEKEWKYVRQNKEK